MSIRSGNNSAGVSVVGSPSVNGMIGMSLPPPIINNSILSSASSSVSSSSASSAAATAKVEFQAVILAAGIASRLRPLTNNTPKCLLKVGDKSILTHTLENLISNNITDVVLVTGYLENLIN